MSDYPLGTAREAFLMKEILANEVEIKRLKGEILKLKEAIKESK
jgi:hypothetical protein